MEQKGGGNKFDWRHSVSFFRRLKNFIIAVI
jgi:hypothetical protein